MSFRRAVGRVCAALACLVALIVPTASAQTSELRAVEGDWNGSISFVGATAQTVQPFRGGFEFTSAGGQVEGTFNWGGGVTQIEGVVAGPDTMPRFNLTSVVSNGVAISDVAGGGEIMLTAATCERLEGTGVNIDVETMGRAEIGAIVWWAIRGEAASDPAAFFEAFEALQIKVGDLLKSFDAGAVIAGGGIVGQIEPLLTEAETLAAELGRTDGCGLEFYRSVIAAEVGRLLDFVLNNPDVNAFTLGQVFLMAVRAGVFGSGGETASADVEVAAHGLLAERIAAAIEAGNNSELEVLGLIAEDMGWIDLADEALFALVRIGS